MQPRLGAIAVVVYEGRFLLVKRKNQPNAGTWGFAGGHVEIGETALAAAARELAEETGVIAQPERYITNIDVITRDGAGAIAYHFLLAVVECRYISGTPVASDDVSDAGWFTSTEAQALDQSPGVQTILDLFCASERS